MTNNSLIYLSHSPQRGRGVFAAKAIPAGKLIEVCPVIILSAKDREIIHGTFLHDYYFLWDPDGCAIALGYGSIYNHSSDPNADYAMDYEKQTIEFHSIKNISKGEEIMVNYTEGDDVMTELWFEER